jgi:hypothetical protein
LLLHLGFDGRNVVDDRVECVSIVAKIVGIAKPVGIVIATAGQKQAHCDTQQQA